MAYLFDEVNDKLVCQTPIGGSSIVSCTFSVWVKLTDNTGSQVQYIVSTGLPDANPSINWYIVEASFAAPGSRNEIAFQISDTDTTDSVTVISTGQPFLSNTSWTHIVLVKSSNVLTQYINGSADGTSTVAGLAFITLADGIYIASRLDEDADRFLGGSLAEFGFWSRALNTSEIASLSRGFSPKCFPQSLDAYIPLLKNDNELTQNLTTNLTGATATDHPRIIYPSRLVLGHTIQDLSQTITLTGLSTTSALGSPSLELNMSLTGLSSVGALGSPSITTDDTVSLSGLASTNAIGTVVVSRENTIDLSGLASVSALGTPVIANTQIIVLTGLSSTEALGTPQVSNLQTISFDGLSSQSSIGSLEVANVQYIVLEGLSAESVFGTPVLADLGFSRVTPTTGDFTYVPF